LDLSNAYSLENAKTVFNFDLSLGVIYKFPISKNAAAEN
jgi:hypothetical protein